MKKVVILAAFVLLPLWGTAPASASQDKCQIASVRSVEGETWSCSYTGEPNVAAINIAVSDGRVRIAVTCETTSFVSDSSGGTVGVLPFHRPEVEECSVSAVTLKSNTAFIVTAS